MWTRSVEAESPTLSEFPVLSERGGAGANAPGPWAATESTTREPFTPTPGTLTVIVILLDAHARRAHPTSLRRFARVIAMPVPALNKRMENSELTPPRCGCRELRRASRAVRGGDCRLNATKFTEIGPMSAPSCRGTPTPWSRFLQAADRRTDPMSPNCDTIRPKIRGRDSPLRL